MRSKWLLITSSVYMALIGMGYLIFPAYMIQSMPAVDINAALQTELRVVAATFFGLAVLNWCARNAMPSAALDAIFYGNLVGFGLAALLDVVEAVGVVGTFGWLFATIHLFFTLAFAVAVTTNNVEHRADHAGRLHHQSG